MPLKIRRRKDSPNWYLRGTVRGIPVDETTGTDRREVANDIRIRLENELLDRSVHGPSAGGAPASFVAAALAYLEAASRSRQTKRYVRLLSEHFVGKPLSALTQETADAAARTLYPHATPETRNRQVYTPLAAILHGAGVAIAIKRPKQKKGRNRAISQDQAGRLLAHATGAERALLLMLFYTGCRITEALSLEWSAIDLKRRAITFDLTKTDEDGEAPMHEAVLEALANLEGREGRVFPWTTRWGAYRALRPICEASGVPFTPHMGRHSFATWLRQQGKDLRLVQEAGRWRDIKSVARYSHVERGEVRDAVSMLPMLSSKGRQPKKGKSRKLVGK